MADSELSGLITRTYVYNVYCISSLLSIQPVRPSCTSGLSTEVVMMYRDGLAEQAPLRCAAGGG